MAFYCFIPPIGGRAQPGLLIVRADDGAHQKTLERFGGDTEEHDNQREQQSSLSVLTDVQNHQLSLGFNFTVGLDSEPWRASGREERRMMCDGKLPHHHVTPVYRSESAAPAPGKNARSVTPALWHH